MHVRLGPFLFVLMEEWSKAVLRPTGTVRVVHTGSSNNSLY